MRVRFHHDPDGQPHFWKHGVSDHEVNEAFERRVEDRPGSDESRVAIGRTKAGRVLRLVYTIDEGGGSVFLITAYELVGKPLAAFRRRHRRGGK